jgi:hypothetical protein
VWKKNSYYVSPYAVQQKKQLDNLENEAYAWIKNNSAREDLFATNYIARTFNLERPIVGLPPGAAFTPENLKKYLKVFKPKGIFTVNFDFKNIFAESGYILKFQNELISVFMKQN